MIKNRIVFFIILVFAAGNLFAHDKGDFMVNIEPQIGFVFPQIELKEASAPYKFDTGNSFGFEYAIRTSFQYYFVDFFAVTAGLGINIFYSFFSDSYYDNNDYMYSSSADFFSGFLNIPVGARFSFSALAFGGGILVNIPMFNVNSIYVGYDEDFTLKFKTYLSYYLEFGFDLSGIKGRSGGFGMLFRYSGSFTGNVVENKRRGIDIDKFRMHSLSLIFQIAIQAAELPIGGRGE